MIPQRRPIVLIALFAFIASLAQAHNPGSSIDIDHPQHEQREQRRRELAPQPVAPIPTTFNIFPRFSNTTTSSTSITSTPISTPTTTSTTIHQGDPVTLTNTQSSTTVTPTGATTSLPNSNGDNQDISKSSEGDLSTPEKIGVGVGVGLGLAVLLLGGFVWLYFYRRKVAARRRISGDESVRISSEDGSGKKMIGWGRGWHTAF